MIILAAFFYYSLAGQPLGNLGWICIYFFCIGAGVSLYFLLTHDFIAIPRKVEFINAIGRWLMDTRPQLDWAPIHPNYVAGIVAIMTPFVAYPAIKLTQKPGFASTLIHVFMITGLGTALLAILMATSRGSILAVASAGGLLVIWWMITKTGGKWRLSRETVFPVLVIIYLCAVIVFLYAGPAQGGGVISARYPYGTGSRAELFARSLFLVSDFPFTGGGLGSFPGLYSHYILGIPFFNVVNSHNLFLDVAIEQGLLGGLSFLMIFLISIWSISQVIVKTDSLNLRVVGSLTFVALIIAFVHGMVDDYLYNGNGAFLSLALAGLAATVHMESTRSVPQENYRRVSLVALGLVAVTIFNWNTFRSAWYANVGAVHLAKVELVGFPTDQWVAPSLYPELDTAQSSLHSALQADPTNRTANHRLGLISMLRGDFLTACAYLESAYEEAPTHRGITKSLGYCYAWLGDREKAPVFLKDIPEALAELDAYIWWWETKGRLDLSDNAVELVAYWKAQLNRE